MAKVIEPLQLITLLYATQKPKERNAPHYAGFSFLNFEF